MPVYRIWDWIRCRVCDNNNRSFTNAAEAVDEYAYMRAYGGMIALASSIALYVEPYPLRCHRRMYIHLHTECVLRLRIKNRTCSQKCSPICCTPRNILTGEGKVNTHAERIRSALQSKPHHHSNGWFSRVK